MTRYIVRETVTLIRYVDADSPAAAIEKAKERGVPDFDEVDNSPRGAHEFAAEIDSELEG